MKRRWIDMFTKNGSNQRSILSVNGPCTMYVHTPLIHQHKSGNWKKLICDKTHERIEETHLRLSVTLGFNDLFNLCL
jgi:hypothetical protein